MGVSQMAIPPPTAAFLLLLCLLLPFSTGATLPGCPTHCGDLEVPFPFGIGPGSNCSLDQSFEILCNTSSKPPKAYLPRNRVDIVTTYWPFPVVEVISIRMDVSQVRVKYPNLAVACYDLGDNRTQQQRGVVLNMTRQHTSMIDFGATAFVFSRDNWVTAIGCDDLAIVTAEDYRTCLSYCVNNRGNGSCSIDGNIYSGNGCCRAEIPKGQAVMSASLSDMHNSLPGSNEVTRSNKLFPCSYAFIAEKGDDQLSFQLDGLENLETFLNQNPIVNNTPTVLDWRIQAAQNCSLATKNSTTFACKENSMCVDYDAAVGGYLCNCSGGYAGNPYLEGAAGCQDIDECASKSSNSCKYTCINTPGSYTCSCPKGNVGDGRLDGNGCTRLPQPKMITLAIGLGSGLGFLLLLVTCFGSYKVFRKRKNKKLREKFFKRNGGLLLQQQQKTNDGIFGKVNLFLARELDKATDHFNESRILGQGGQGTVYKGMLSDGRIVAIKKSKLIDEDQLEQFINEVAILSQINHRNVVKLFGCCLETEVPLLVYEFVLNGTLFQLIHDESTQFPTSWSMRLKIAIDIAGALAYLHSAACIPIYHRDIKSSNILLDEKYIAKISDFGTSKSVAVDQTHVTTLVKGTFGYLDPEYFQSSQFTDKSDVYSFGVVLVELLSGQKPISSNKTQEDRSLASRFLLSMETNSLDTILDSIVSEQGTSAEINLVARLAQRCLNLRGYMRPTMKEVAAELESIKKPSTAEGKYYDESYIHESKDMPVLDIEYTWTTSDSSVQISTSDTHPLMFDS